MRIDHVYYLLGADAVNGQLWSIMFTLDGHVPTFMNVRAFGQVDGKLFTLHTYPEWFVVEPRDTALDPQLWSLRHLHAPMAYLSRGQALQMRCFLPLSEEWDHTYPREQVMRIVSQEGPMLMWTCDPSQLNEQVLQPLVEPVEGERQWNELFAVYEGLLFETTRAMSMDVMDVSGAGPVQWNNVHHTYHVLRGQGKPHRLAHVRNPTKEFYMGRCDSKYIYMMGDSGLFRLPLQ
jgi:hypothetical protein